MCSSLLSRVFLDHVHRKLVDMTWATILTQLHQRLQRQALTIIGTHYGVMFTHAYQWCEGDHRAYNNLYILYITYIKYHYGAAYTEYLHTGRKLPAHKKVNPPLPPPISTLTFCSVSFQAFTVLSQACLAGRQEAASSQKFKSSIHLLLHPSLPSPSVLCPFIIHSTFTDRKLPAASSLNHPSTFSSTHLYPHPLFCVLATLSTLSTLLGAHLGVVCHFWDLPFVSNQRVRADSRVGVV